MTDEKKTPAKKPRATKAEGKPKPKSSKPTEKKQVGRPRTSTRKPPKKKLERPQSRSIEPTTPEKAPPTDQMILDALNDGLTPKEIEFVEVYMTCMNAVKAWMAVHDTDNYKSASSSSTQCLDKPRVKKYLASRMKAAFDRTEEAQDRLIQMYQYLAYADANELVEFRRESCRYCHGDGHLYQFTPQEARDREANYEKQVIEAKEKGITLEPLDPLGGVGFNPKLPPHEDCPECHGEGHGTVFFKDTRNLSPAALALYAGAKVGKDGIEIKMASKEKAMEMLAKILKLAEDKTEFNFNFSKEELEEKFAAKMQQARERMAKVREERQLSDDE